MVVENARGSAWPTIWGRRALPETVLLGLICTLDMLSTLVLVRMGIAEEANPLLAWTLEGTGVAFVIIKTFSYAFPLLTIEYLRDRCSEFIIKALRLGLVGYLLVYVIGSLGIHGLLPW